MSLPPPPRTLPALEPETAFFWTSGADGTLRIQRCADCGRYQHPPLPRCPACHGEAVHPRPVSGKGRIVSWTVNHEAWKPGLDVPFVFAVVELEEQPELYLFTDMPGCGEGLQRGLPVSVFFEECEDVWLPRFAPDPEASGPA